MMSTAAPRGVEGPAVAIAKQRALERFKRATVLQRQARAHGSVTRVGVALRAGFVVLQENLADRAVGISADSGRVAQATDLELERLGGASIRQALALGIVGEWRIWLTS